MKSSEVKTKHDLPDTCNYAIVPAVALNCIKVDVADQHMEKAELPGNFIEATFTEASWLDHAMALLQKDDIVKDDTPTWTAYHASCQTGIVCQAAITQLLPLFYEKAASVSMIKHTMDVVLQATQFLNAGQIPVIACDNPLYAIAKSIQWAWPASHGMDKFVVMQGSYTWKWHCGIQLVTI